MTLTEDPVVRSQYEAEIYNLKNENLKLQEALKEVQRRTGLLLGQNVGRWNMTVEHDRRTIGVLQTNLDIINDALTSS